jgi:hypothetical protein
LGWFWAADGKENEAGKESAFGRIGRAAVVPTVPQ